jgi:predicted acylesterase/phospholipase RssA
MTVATTRRTGPRSTVLRALPPPPPNHGPIGLALAGGGPLGAIYEIGAICALSESLDGVDFNRDISVYVGVSAGAFIAAGLANGVTPHEMARMFIESETATEPFDPSLLLRPAFREYFDRAMRVPPVVASAMWRVVSRPHHASLMGAFQRLGELLPTGVFDNRKIDTFLARMFSQGDRVNDFRRLGRKLVLVATELDTGQSVQFGQPGLDHVPISTAVQASAALPGLFPPVEIDGRFYVDGALKRTLHASVALEAGMELVLCVNPLVPFSSPRRRNARAHQRLVDGGLPAVLSQTFRSIIHSRMQVGMSRYERQFSDADVLLFEPHPSDADIFYSNIFSYSNRKRLAEHAYQRTRSQLFERRHELAPMLERHGVGLRVDVLTDRERTLVSAAHHRNRMKLLPLSHATDALAECLDDLERWVRAREAAAAA